MELGHEGEMAFSVGRRSACAGCVVVRGGRMLTTQAVEAGNDGMDRMVRCNSQYLVGAWMEMLCILCHERLRL